ncbi:cysteine hydrolase [Nocardia terpenica]|uniref:cysteine hydrolase family protein n=1 Tax=Nocardia terpenica TaxID=455432 RepID=UPI001893968F|nr:isochorismatase family cysteine hydrolase [Nocardia terpenica]MBF6059350.1 cysteine hydrolase [Nocardia terpenica]MBF6103111.1 cysteine hydrolase [Nocardia terpenica]MBF6110700.1 cysteine hydrolase [Nocardia terpenica]MBF6116831.1 cysteine hydrolase [Nocardia terpenica]
MAIALIVGDFQAGITRAHAFARELVPTIAALVARAREEGALIVFIRTSLRPNGLDVAPANAVIAALHAQPDYHEGSPGTDLDPGLGATDADAVVVKHRASAFTGTDLDLILRARGVTSVVVAGVATSAMVAATVYEALDRDYRVAVVRDGCADPDPQVHRFFVDTVFPGRGVDVVTADGWSARERGTSGAVQA